MDLKTHPTYTLQGFGESPYLQRILRETFEPKGIRVVTADEPSKKAVSEGGAPFFAEGNVVARAMRREFGLISSR